MFDFSPVRHNRHGSDRSAQLPDFINETRSFESDAAILTELVAARRPGQAHITRL
jgi:hypothetical protein